MSSFNRVTLMGRVVRDPELRHTQGGTAVCTFSLAVNERFKDKNGEWQEKGHFFDCTVFAKRGEAFSKHHRKGSLAFVDGRLSQDVWQDKDTGQNRSKVKVIVNEWQFVNGSKQQGGNGGAAQTPTDKSWGVDGPGDFLGTDNTPF